MPKTADYSILIILFGFIAASIWIAILAQRAVSKGSFLSGFFLGNRGLGAWALALTATVQSGGTFMGYPSYVYSHGWVIALWIAGYMAVPITGFGILAKRLARLSRRTNAITVPDLFRERFNSPTAGVVASLFIMIFMTFTLVAQFKAGAVIMEVVWHTAFPVPEEEVAQTAPSSVLAPPATQSINIPYLTGLVLFSVIVVGYTMLGGFLAAVWTDLFQSLMMWIGVMVLLGLTWYHVPDIEQATRQAVAKTSVQYAYPPGYSASGDGRKFLTPSLAFSVFLIWIFSGVGSPASLVRLMACKDTATIRRSVFLLSIYNLMIYLPLLWICIAARAVMPDLAQSDKAIPAMAIWTTRGIWGGSILAGLVLIAPFGAVMATVSSYLVLIASGIVCDIYQRFFHPQASPRQLQWMTHLCMVSIGLIAIVANIRPVEFLQAIVVFCGNGLASTFVVPACMTAFWRRGTGTGATWAMICGAGTCLILLAIGMGLPDPLLGPKTAFRSYYLLGLEPVVWGLSASALAGIVVSLATEPPSAARLAQLFDS